MALKGGSDGLDFYRRITKEAGSYLQKGGWLCLEIGYDQGESVRRMLIMNDYRDVSVTQDYAGMDRVVCGRK